MNERFTSSYCSETFRVSRRSVCCRFQTVYLPIILTTARNVGRFKKFQKEGKYFLNFTKYFSSVRFSSPHRSETFRVSRRSVCYRFQRHVQKREPYFLLNVNTSLPSVVAFAENHAAPGVARVADFRQCCAAIRAFQATVVPIPIHREQQPSFDYLATTSGALLDTRRSARTTFLLQQKGGSSVNLILLQDIPDIIHR